MEFNAYVWSLYRSSAEGAEFISSMRPIDEFRHDDGLLYLDEVVYPKIEKYGEVYTHAGRVNIQKLYHHYFRSQLPSVENAESLFNRWVAEGVTYRGVELIGADHDAQWWQEIGVISNALYATLPDFFFPYFFQHAFDQFQAICESISIYLPAVPLRKRARERTLYYLQICQALYEFRCKHELSPPELLALIYDFVPRAISNSSWVVTDKEKLPMPNRVWYVGCGGRADLEFVDNAGPEEMHYWQASLDTRIGDILIMYCWSPRSYIHSVWRAVSNGFADPFFYYHKLAWIAYPIRVPPIHWQEIKGNAILSTSPLVKNNFQGVNGYPVTYVEYQELLRLWAARGMDTTCLPTIAPVKILDPGISLDNERDVEEKLIEPLLLKLNYAPQDWIRQMPIKMGRRNSYYPDYCFAANAKRGDESAKMLLEAKFSIQTDKELLDAFLQAKSYAIRLQARKLILAAKEGLWYFERNGTSFFYDEHQFFSWNDVEAPDKFHLLTKLIGGVR